MDPITSSDLFVEILGFLKEAINWATNCGLFFVKYTKFFFNNLHDFTKTTILILLSLAIVGVVMSHVLAIWRNRNKWKLNSGSNLMLSYFCGSGKFQQKLIYHDAHQLLRDNTWSWISIAGLGWRLGNYSHPSILLIFFFSIIYLPLVLLGKVEMAFRIIIGTIWLVFASLFHTSFLFVMRLITCMVIPIGQFVDRTMRKNQRCPYCYTNFDLPWFKCPYCGALHKTLLPSRCGILVARCVCGRCIPTSLLTGRSTLESVCPKCNKDLVATNARQFSIQLIGGNSSGKTAYLSSFQHIYLASGTGHKNTSIIGEPCSDFKELEEMYNRGTTDPSSTSTVQTYNFIHMVGHVAKYNLVIHSIPDEVILNGEFERNPLILGNLDGVVILIDPLSVSSVREECLNDGDHKSIENCSKDAANSIIVNFIQQYSAIVGRSAQKMENTPVAVLITKTDIKAIKRKVGSPKIKATFNKNPIAYQNDIREAQYEICRAYLLDLGLANGINNLESVFSNVKYFPISAIGHISEAGKPFNPSGIMEPMAWIAKQTRLSPLLKNINLTIMKS